MVHRLQPYLHFFHLLMILIFSYLNIMLEQDTNIHMLGRHVSNPIPIKSGSLAGSGFQV